MIRIGRLTTYHALSVFRIPPAGAVKDYTLAKKRKALMLRCDWYLRF